jgi:hypothetical protein
MKFTASMMNLRIDLMMSIDFVEEIEGKGIVIIIKMIMMFRRQLILMKKFLPTEQTEHMRKRTKEG